MPAEESFPDRIYKSVTVEDPGQDGSFTYVASTEQVDRYGDIVRQDWNLDPYRQNPIVLFGHDQKVIIGTSPDIWVAKHEHLGPSLMSRIQLAAKGTSEFIDTVRSLVAQRILRAVSVGFSPINVRKLTASGDKPNIGFEFLRSELLEQSLCAVPANSGALAVMKSFDLSEDERRALLLGAMPRATMSAARARLELMKLR